MTPKAAPIAKGRDSASAQRERMNWFIPYVFLVAGLLVFGHNAAVLACRCGRPVFLTAGLAVAALLHLAAVVPGWFGYFNTVAMWSAAAAGAFAAALVLAAAACHAPPPPGERDSWLGASSAGFGWVIGLGAALSLPLWRYYLWLLLARLLRPEEPLEWDAVSYHLPAYIEFLQAGTLWTFEGPYQSYHYGFELLGNFLSHPFYTHWGLVVADAFSVGLFLAALAALVAALDPTTAAASGDMSPRQWAATLWAAGLSSWACFRTFGEVGKNDVFLAATLLAAGAFLVRALRRGGAAAARRRSDLALAGIAYGLAVATKPTALGWLPLFAVAALLAGGPRRRIGSLAVFGIVAFAVGGWWPLRNLVEFGELSPSGSPWQRSIMASLADPALYRLHRWSAVWLWGWLAAPAGLWLWRAERRAGRDGRGSAFALAMLVCAGAVYIATPFVVFPDYWILRLGLPFFAAASVIYGLCVARVWEQTATRRLNARSAGILPSEGAPSAAAHSRYRARLVQRGIPLALGLGLLWLPVHWAARRPSGLPGYESVKGLPPTRFYAWVLANETPLRIYSAGLRPYGLYGPRWRNAVFYDLGSVGLEPLEKGIARLAAVLAQFHPDLVAISVDPHPQVSAAGKPELVAWMHRHPQWFTEVFTDAAVSAFRVEPAAREALRDRVPPGYVARRRP